MRLRKLLHFLIQFSTEIGPQGLKTISQFADMAIEILEQWTPQNIEEIKMRQIEKQKQKEKKKKELKEKQMNEILNDEEDDDDVQQKKIKRKRKDDEDKYNRKQSQVKNNINIESDDESEQEIDNENQNESPNELISIILGILSAVGSETQTINQQTSEKEKQKEKENIKGIKDQEKQASTSESLDYQRDLKTFREALAELRDPIVPVRAHGIRELAKLCRKNSTVAQENHTKISDLLLTLLSGSIRLALSEVVLKTLQRKFNIIPHFAPLFFEPLFTMASKANLYQQTKQSKDSHNSIQQSSAMVVLACLCELWGSGVQQVVQRVASLAERTLQLPSSADVQRRASALLFTSLLRALLPKDNERESDVMGATISSAQQIYGDNETPLSMLTPTFVPQYANRYHSSQSSSDSQDPFTLSQQHFHSSSSSSSFSILNAHIDILIRAQTQFEIHSDQSMEKDETVRKHCLIGISVINDCKNVLRRIPEIGEDKQESNTVTDNLIFTQIFAGHI
ncbi:MAG: hypothetical protein EZS28_010834 [Streblomastix strix]|uniref:RNA polymerase II assembly factor Rtp1 C-terminal domain-containing protein n=1 Tax=Streblomastix strix TaxID=222440 RepID=A0A5J4WH70_9EUKA|nr:MAG: hypothetical protein EZS28_010834 [Streblomastix strix]